MPEDRSPLHIQVNVALGDGAVHAVQDGNLHMVTPAGRGASSPTATLREVSDEAIREIAYVLPPVPGRTAGVRLDDHLYVHRGIEGAVMQDVHAQLSAIARGGGERPKATAILANPGYGKSCLLWWLHRQLRDDADVFLVPAAALTTDEAPGLGSPWLLAGLEQAASSRPAVLLLDTADTLLHRPQDVAMLVRLLSRLSELGVPTVVASRAAEAARLEQEHHGHFDSLLDKHALGAYSEEEWPLAVDAYAAVYHRPPGHPPPVDGGVTPVEHLPVDANRVRSEIGAAVARGLPMREIVIHPLSLRMLFEVYAPNSPTAEVDVSDLHDLLWRARVVKDKRAHADPAAKPTSAAASKDLSLVASELGLAMVREGTFSITYATCAGLVAARLNLSPEDVDAGLSELARRDVIRLRTSEGAAISFWHQTMAEHAAGRAMAAYGSAGLELLAQRILAYPDDLLLAEIARHAFQREAADDVLGLRHGTSHLCGLLAHDHPFIRLTALRIYAQLRHVPVAVSQAAREALNRAETWEIIQFLDVLGSVRRSAEDLWPTELSDVWRRDQPAERARLLHTLARLAHQQPDRVREFLREHRVLIDDEQGPLDLSAVPTGQELSIVLRRFQYADPAHAQARIATLWRAARANRDGGFLRHLLSALRDLLESGHRELDDFAAEIPELIGAMGQRNWSGGFELIIEAASAAWAASSAARLPDPGGDAAGRWDKWVRALEAESLSSADRVRLRGIALHLRGYSGDTIEEALDALLRVRSPAGQDHLARYLLAPLLGAGEEPGGRAARQYCATHLSVAQASLTLALTQRTRLRLPCSIVAACVPEQEPEAWLEEPWPIVLTARAAAGGHASAQRALQCWLDDPGPLRDRVGAERAAMLRTEVAKDVGEATSLLDWLLHDARRSGDFRAISHLAQRGGPVVQRHPGALGELAVTLAQVASPGVRDVGFQLLTRLVLDRHAPEILTSSWLAERIAVEDNHQVFRKVAKLAEAYLLGRPRPAEPDHLDRVFLSLQARIDDGGQFLARRRWSETGDREHVFAGAAAHRLLLTLYAVFARIGPTTWPQTEATIVRLAFEPLEAHLPPDATEPAEWATRLASLPQLASRLADAGRIGDALGLMNHAINVISDADPNPRAKWKNGHASRWRPFLRKVAISERSRLADLICKLAERDEFFARHLIEISGQELVDIGEQLQELRHAELTVSMQAYVRKTTEWAGRKDPGDAWRDLYARLNPVAAPLRP
jgi:hypothetical protein